MIKPKNIFLSQFKIVQNFHYFCKVCACRISVKNSIFQKCLKLWRNTSLDEGNKLFSQKIFPYHNLRENKISLFL